MDILNTVKSALYASGADIDSIGKSACGNDILCAHCGDYAGKQIIVTAAIHARECYTALVPLHQIECFPKRFNRGGVYFIPLVNPDGALFFETGNTQGAPTLIKNAKLHREWKANAQGVDLNCNFDARFGTGRGNTHKIGAHGNIGDHPLCAPESRALARFTTDVMPNFTVSYHCMGGELYWEFYRRDTRERDMRYASAIAEYLGIRRVDGELGSAGGYKDYCVESLGIPSVTIELIARGEHPFAPSDYDADIVANAHLPIFILNMLNGETHE